MLCDPFLVDDVPEPNEATVIVIPADCPEALDLTTALRLHEIAGRLSLHPTEAIELALDLLDAQARQHVPASVRWATA